MQNHYITTSVIFISCLIATLVFLAFTPDFRFTYGRKAAPTVTRINGSVQYVVASIPEAVCVNGQPAVTMSWRAPSAASRFTVMRSVSESGDWERTPVDKQVRAYADVLVESGLTYNYQIKAVDSQKVVRFSNITSVTIPSCPDTIVEGDENTDEGSDIAMEEGPSTISIFIPEAATTSTSTMPISPTAEVFSDTAERDILAEAHIVIPAIAEQEVIVPQAPAVVSDTAPAATPETVPETMVPALNDVPAPEPKSPEPALVAFVPPGIAAVPEEVLVTPITSEPGVPVIPSVAEVKLPTVPTPAPDIEPVEVIVAPVIPPVQLPITPAITAPAQPSAPSSGNGRLKWGAYAGWQHSEIEAFEDQTENRFDMLATFAHWGNNKEFPTHLSPYAKDKGRTLVIFWEATDYTVASTNQPKYSYDAVLNGDWNGYLDEFAQDAKAYGGPIILIPYSEMNGNWFPWSGSLNNNTPEKSIRAYRYIHDRFKNVSNVDFGWAPNSNSVPDTVNNAHEKYYPGDDYVDYVGVDGFNFANPWLTFDQVFGDALKRLSVFNKPLYIFSMASADGDAKAEWMKDAFEVQMPKYQLLEGWVWFNENKERDWRLWSDTDSFNALKRMIGI